MKFTLTPKLTLVLFCATVSGCAGDRALIMTKTNVGIDVDSKPPTAEITIARRELAILPTFPETVGIDSGNKSTKSPATDGKSNSNPENRSKSQGTAIPSTEKQAVTQPAESMPINKPDGNSTPDERTSVKEGALPILASFDLQGNFFSPRIIGQFAGGDAAVYLAQDPTDDNSLSVDSSLCLKNKPEDTRGWFLKLITDKESYEKEPHPFYFATDTAYGLKVAWSGTSGPYPDSLKLGFNRKEFASPHIFVDQGCGNDPKRWNVKLPSFYASIDNASALEIFEKAKVNHVQFFATGQAATKFAQRASIRQVAFQNMAPDAAKSEAESLNRDLIGEIVETFEADTAGKDAILAKAVELGLVPNNTKASEFKDKLNINATGINYSVATKLNQLRIVASMLKKASASSGT